jgi:hypothetical protein
VKGARYQKYKSYGAREVIIIMAVAAPRGGKQRTATAKEGSVGAIGFFVHETFPVPPPHHIRPPTSHFLYQQPHDTTNPTHPTPQNGSARARAKESLRLNISILPYPVPKRHRIF